MRYRIMLERTTDASAVRTPSVRGIGPMIALGRSVYILAPSLTPGLRYREVSTSPVVALEDTTTTGAQDRTFEIRTASGSRYIVTVFGQATEVDEP